MLDTPLGKYGGGADAHRGWVAVGVIDPRGKARHKLPGGGKYLLAVQRVESIGEIQLSQHTKAV